MLCWMSGYLTLELSDTIIFNIKELESFYAMCSVLQIKMVKFLFFYTFLRYSYMWYLDYLNREFWIWL